MGQDLGCGSTHSINMPSQNKYHRHALYEAAVQEPEAEVSLLSKIYRQISRAQAYTLREDFCATFANSCAWVRQGVKHRAIAVDIDGEPLAYGWKHHALALSPSERERLKLVQADAIKAQTPKADMTLVGNFSIGFIQERKLLLRYFSNARRSLHKNGILVIDLLGGFAVGDGDSDERPIKLPGGGKATYFWEEEGFNPISHRIKYSIHFGLKDGTIKRHAFRYDWRIWSIPEIRDAMCDAGYKSTRVYWEGDDNRGGGNGIFKARENAENSATWIAYVVGIKS